MKSLANPFITALLRHKSTSATLLFFRATRLFTTIKKVTKFIYLFIDCCIKFIKWSKVKINVVVVVFTELFKPRWRERKKKSIFLFKIF